LTIEIVISSTNQGKIAEIIEIMSDLDVRWLTGPDVGGWPEIEETEDSYLGNALIKARVVSLATGKPALADDSGIEVDALEGDPGVRSARWAGPGATDQDNNEKLRHLMAAVHPDRREARYRCAVVVAFPDGHEISAVGNCEGRIGDEPKGSGGFGYDPWFYPAGETRSMAELSANEKHAISHRGMALRGLRAKISERLRIER